MADAGQDLPAQASQLLLLPALGDRAQALSVAQGVEMLAVREGAGARAASLHLQAAALLERVFRTFHKEQDGKEALEVYRAAQSNLALPGACTAALKRAFLTGEIARDAGRTYAELYRVQRRSGGGGGGGGGASVADAGGPGCAQVAPALERLAAFRPPPAVLEAIDDGLLGEGDLALVDASTARVRVAPRVLRVEHWSQEDSARVVVVLDRPAPFRVLDEPPTAQSGPRTVVEIDGAEPRGPGQIPLKGIVRGVRVEATSTGSRVALDLGGPCYRKVFHLVEPYRVVIDIAKNPPGMLTKGKRSVSRVVLDPGHGGTDPGAIGPAGSREKDTTLAIAHRVAPMLAKQGLEVALTRDGDVFVSLEERTARANSFGADLFVSIHCNAAENHGRKGIETYVLDTTMTDLAARVAARENATTTAATQELSGILANMRIADQATRSTRMAELLQKAAMAGVRGKYPDAVDGGVHTAGFYVLVGARMPAVLFETSYISHPVEEQRLVSDDYRSRLADAIVNAIKAYREGR